MAVNSLFAKITLPKKPANWMHLRLGVRPCVAKSSAVRPGFARVVSDLDPEVPQSGLGEFFVLAWRILGKWLANCSANFDGEFSCRFFGLFSFQRFRPTPKFTPEIVGIPLQFRTPFSAQWRDQQISFEPGFGAYQSLAHKMKVAFSRIFAFLQF